MIKKYQQFLESKNNKDLWDIIPKSVKKLHSLFSENDKKLYVVGGAVRDFLTGDKPKDFDLCTDALPEEVIQIIGDTYKTNLQGKAFGVVVVYTDDEPGGMEIATFRQDISRGRRPEVKLGVTMQDDVSRRDLTYNALFYDLDTRQIVDLTGGVKDIESGLTRMVGDAYERIEEDSLRILRTFRFAARYNHPIEKSTADAIKKRPQLQNIDPESGQIKRISTERIIEELKKAWGQVKSYDVYLNFFNQFEMWDQIFPGAEINTQIKKCNNFICYMANLFKFENTKNLERKLINDFRFDYESAYQIVFLINLLDLSGDNVFELFKQKIKSKCPDDIIIDWLKLNSIENNRLHKKFLTYVPKVSAEELMAQGYKGKALGDEIKKREAQNFLS